jgi:hypothetical protein
MKEMTLGQELTMDLIAASEPDEARVIGWHEVYGGPLVVRKDERWQVILPDGKIKTLAKVYAD